ncbi:MAG: VOC family protein [Bacteroidales bacterium]|nr:VOC family protein [Bacteroidales bacterium]
MKRVTGLGGIFFKCENPQNIKNWYKKHLGIASDEYGGLFEWRDAENPEQKCYTAWNPFDKNTSYFNPGNQSYMINYRVEDLKGLLEILKNEGVKIIGEIEEYEYGKFGWILDQEGNKIELWEPVEKKLK